MTLTFSEKAHRYTLDGRPVPGVTTLIKKGLPAEAITYWATRTTAEYVCDHYDKVGDMLRTGGRGPTVGFLKGVPWQRRDEAALRGTDIHALADQLAAGEAVDVPEEYQPHVDGYVRWLDAWQPTVIIGEVPVGNRHWWYAGTPDLVAEIGGVTWLLDVKTGAGVYGNFALQLVAYGNAEFYMDNGAEHPMPAVDRYGVLHVTDSGVNVHEVINPDAAWKDFLHVQWTAKARDRIDNYLTEPLPGPDGKAIA